MSSRTWTSSSASGPARASVQAEIAPGAITLTGPGVVSRIFTDLAVVDVTPDGFRVAELAPGVTFEEVQQKTGAPILPPN